MIENSDLGKPIYVLLYHPWMEGFEGYFRTHLAWLRENGFESIAPEQIIRYLRDEEGLVPERPIAITLDDGTIENYTLAYPVLKEYGFTGTVFAPTAEKYLRLSGKEWWGEVESAGVLRIEGHSHSHALVFINDRVEDVYIEKKEDREPIIKGLGLRTGSPIFRLGYELVSRRFIPWPDFVERCVDYVKGQGEAAFFEREGWKEDLFHLISEYEGSLGRFETEDEKRIRIEEELGLSKAFIEEALGQKKSVHFFAYPFGAYDAGLVEILKDQGYMGALTTLPGGNKRGDDPFLIKRMTILAEDSFGGLGNILNEY